jgi:hypothetical protein
MTEPPSATMRLCRGIAKLDSKAQSAAATTAQPGMTALDSSLALSGRLGSQFGTQRPKSTLLRAVCSLRRLQTIEAVAHRRRHRHTLRRAIVSRCRQHHRPVDGVQVVVLPQHPTGRERRPGDDHAVPGRPLDGPPRRRRAPSRHQRPHRPNAVEILLG